ncbi:MAG: hydrogenase maturation protease [Acidobacteriota bacterium]|jgi:hydrogenase maturation protease
MIATVGDEVAAVAVVGIGNSLAGDDGAGPAVVEALRAQLGEPPGVLLERLDGDLFAVAELLPRARRFVFVDAVIGSPPGQVIRRAAGPAHLAPSLHQADIGAVMTALAALEVVAPFPPWEVWGITISPPQELAEELSPPVGAAVTELVAELARLLMADGAPAGKAS